ncbi:hypothetical protein M9434_001176 [Picochlorum sp. BPE23]|nr:hypothetical protein M9434_001176 [Picochlorum sp. BPE23]
MTKTTTHKSFGFRTTALEAVEGFDLSGKTALVTGGNSGIGVETVRALASAGCNVILCSRKVEAGQEVADSIAPSVKGNITVEQLDLSDLDNVKACAARVLESHPKIHLLVLNAGVMACPLTRTAQGFEQTMGVCHFGHVYLTQRLLPAVKAAGTPGDESRIVVVSSLAHTFGSIVLDDLNWDTRRYWSWAAYGQAKLANVLFARELAVRLKDDNVLAYSLHPGSIVTNLQRYSWYILPIQYALFFMRKTIPQGASTTIVACTAKGIESGEYLSDCHVTKTSKQGQDMDMAHALWDKTCEILKDKGFAE